MWSIYFKRLNYILFYCLFVFRGKLWGIEIYFENEEIKCIIGNNREGVDNVF